jgi:hypothetical protein
MQFSLASHHFLPLESKYSLQHLVLKHPQLHPLMPETKFHNHIKQQIKLYFITSRFFKQHIENKTRNRYGANSLDINFN